MGDPLEIALQATQALVAVQPTQRYVDHTINPAHNICTG